MDGWTDTRGATLNAALVATARHDTFLPGKGYTGANSIPTH